MSAPPYPKIENLYVRSPDGKSTVVGVRRRLETGLINKWLATEKIDGTNIRVSLEEVAGPPDSTGWEVAFYGKTNKAQMPDFIQEYLEAAFKLEDVQRLWQCRRNCDKCGGSGTIPGELGGFTCDNVEPYPITLYGEAYGARIQKGGGDYRRAGDVSFRLFDVLVAEKYWLSWESVVSIAGNLDIKTVPFMGVHTTNDIANHVRIGFMSKVAEEEGTPRLAEGIVARTDPYLFDNNGRRVVFKTKTKDY